MPNIKRGMMGAAGVSTSAPAVPGELWSWGRNNKGQIGIGNVINKSSPVQVGSLTDWTVLNNSQSYYTFVENEDGDVWVWGLNTSGTLGIGNIINQSSPVQLEATGTWVEIVSNGSNITIGVKENGTLWTWGLNSTGSMGQGDSGVKRSSPTQVGSLTDWANVATSGDSCTAVKTDGTLWFWGNSGSGRSGTGGSPAIDYSSPVQIGSLTNWSKVFGGDGWFLSIKTDGTLWSWGSNSGGQLALGDRINRSSPVQVGSLTTWVSAQGAGQWSAFLKTDGTLWVVGNNQGQLGDETDIAKSSPIQLGSASNWTKFATGGYCGFAVNEDGELWTWGRNQEGNMGLGEGGDVRGSSPVQIGSLTTWVNVNSGGTGTTRAIKTAS